MSDIALRPISVTEMIENIDWESAINIRRSIRSYEMREVDDESISSLKSFISNMKLPFKHYVKISFFKANANKRLYTGFV
ncbi:MAG: hypothetical protein ABFD15_03820 [Methanofastidiosum sp.]